LIGIPSPELKKNILYISYDGMTDQLGQSQVLPYLCELQKHGYSIHLVSCEKPDRLEQQRTIVEEVCRANNISWHPLHYTKRPPVLSTVKDVFKIRKLALRLHRLHDFKMIHCRGYISSLVGLEMKRKLGTGFLFDMRGLWANEKVDAGSWNLRNPVYRLVYNFFKKKERQFFEKADHTISLTHAAKKEIQSWDYMKQNPVPISVIPCCADLDHFDPAHVDPLVKEKIRKELNIKEGEPILGYLGSIGSWYMLEEMLDLFVVYQKKYAEARFLFITMDQHALIRAKAAERNIPPEKIIIRPALRKEVPVCVSIFTHSVFFIRPTYSKISSSPTKQAELMGMGVPVICNDGVGDTGEIVEKYKSGIAIKNFDDGDYKNAVAGIGEYVKDAQHIREGAFDYFSLGEGVKKYLSVYQQICK
jgi:glycosyltransferase involved in cell wall biosynthesis